MAADIPALVAPILAGKADVVIGAPPHQRSRILFTGKEDVAEVRQRRSPFRQQDQYSGCAERIPGHDPRSRHALQCVQRLHLYIGNHNPGGPEKYSDDLCSDTGQRHLAAVAPRKSNSSYIRQSLVTIVRIFVVYKAFRFFMSVGVTALLLGLIGGVRYLYYYMAGNGAGHVQSLILSSILMGVGFQTILTAFLADLLAVNRRLMEDVQCRVKNWMSFMRGRPSTHR